MDVLERARLRSRKNYANNPDKVLQDTLRWKQGNPERYAANQARYRSQHRAKAAETSRLWRKNHPGNRRSPEKKRELLNRHRARKRGARVVPITSAFFITALKAWDRRCAYCQLDLRGVRLEWDHFVPLARGGAHAEHNLVPACPSCNRRKNARDPFSFLFDRQNKAP